MKESEFVGECISLISGAVPDGVSVRTKGGDLPADPPFCIMDRESNNVNDQGANPRAGTIRDTRDYAVGIELHRTAQMDVTWNVRSYSEAERDDLVETIKDAFFVFESKPSLFHIDTYNWEVDRSTPVANPVAEPDWYESTITVRCRFVRRVVQDESPIEQVDETYTYE